MHTRLEIFSGFAMLSLAIIGHGCLTLWSDAMRNDHAPPTAHPPAQLCATSSAHQQPHAHPPAHSHQHAPAPAPAPVHSHSHQYSHAPPAHSPTARHVHAHSTGDSATLWLDRAVVTVGQPLAVSFTVESQVAEDAWIGVIPAHIPHGREVENDLHDVSYQYLRGQAAGTFQFEAPVQPGHYEFRLHDTDANGRELAAIGFEVVAAGQWVTR